MSTAASESRIGEWYGKVGASDIFQGTAIDDYLKTIENHTVGLAIQELEEGPRADLPQETCQEARAETREEIRAETLQVARQTRARPEARAAYEQWRENSLTAACDRYPSCR